MSMQGNPKRDYVRSEESPDSPREVTRWGTLLKDIDTLRVKALGGSLWRKLGSLGAIAGLRQVKQKIDKRRYNGVVLLGLNHLAVKSHGSADAQAFSCAIGVAHKVIKHELINKVHVAFEKMQALRRRVGIKYLAVLIANCYGHGQWGGT